MFIALLIAAQAPAAAAPAAPEKKRCRQIEELGSRVARQDCRTAAEWKAADAARVSSEGRAQLERSQNEGVRPQ